ncbi:MAG: hypothetical protein R2687_02470 [Candidatus Nanopelagicales bacterium]
MKQKWTGAWLFVVALVLALIPMTANAASLPAPSLLTPTAGATVDQPLFSWTPVAGAAYYEIQVALDDQFVTVTDPPLPTDPVAVSQPRPVHGTTYVPTFSYSAKAHYWHVRAVGTDGTKGQWSASGTFTRRWTNDDEATGVQADDPASRVENVRLLTGGTTPALNDIAITWDPVPGAAYYQLQIAPTNSPDETITCTTPHVVLAAPSDGAYLRRDPLIDGCLGLAIDSLPFSVRVRAVDFPVAPDYPAILTTPVFSKWSDERQEPGGTLPTPFEVMAGPATGTGPLGNPAIPDPDRLAVTDSDVPVLSWEPADGAVAYRVVIALDRDFTNRVAEYRTRGSVFVPPETYDDNGPAGTYYWFATPCGGGGCSVPDRIAINDARYVGHFSKRSQPVLNLTATAFDDDRNVLLRWGDALTSARAVHPASSPGGVEKYQIQLTTGNWSASADIQTDNLAYSTAVEPLAPGTYRWRVRPLDGQSVPLAWAYGPDFTIDAPDDPSPAPTTPGIPGTSPAPTGPPPVYQAPGADEGDAAEIAPDPPGKPRVTKVSKRKVRVHWRASEELGQPVSAYLVFRSKNGTSFKRVRSTTSQTTRIKVKRGRTYWFYVIADSDAGRSGQSRTTRFRMPR